MPVTELDLARDQLCGLADYGRKYREPQYVEAINDAIRICDRLGARDPAMRILADSAQVREAEEAVT